MGVEPERGFLADEVVVLLFDGLAKFGKVGGVDDDTDGDFSREWYSPGPAFGEVVDVDVSGVGHEGSVEMSEEGDVVASAAFCGSVEEPGDEAETAAGIDDEIGRSWEETIGGEEGLGGELDRVGRGAFLQFGSGLKDLSAGALSGIEDGLIEFVALGVVRVIGQATVGPGEEGGDDFFNAEAYGGSGLVDAEGFDFVFDAELAEHGHDGGQKGLADDKRRAFVGVEDTDAIAALSEERAERGAGGTATEDGDRLVPGRLHGGFLNIDRNFSGAEVFGKCGGFMQVVLCVA